MNFPSKRTVPHARRGRGGLAILALVALPCALIGIGVAAGISALEARAKEPVKRPFEQEAWLTADLHTNQRAAMVSDIQSKMHVGMEDSVLIEMLGEPDERPFGDSLAWYSLGPSNDENGPGTLHLVLRFDGEQRLESWWVSND